MFNMSCVVGCAQSVHVCVTSVAKVKFSLACFLDTFLDRRLSNS